MASCSDWAPASPSCDAAAAREPHPPNRQSSCATALDVPNALKFVFTAIALMLAARCFSLGIFIDVQRP